MPEAVQPPRAIGNVAVIGAGQAGRRFALRCALAGFKVILEDVMPANLRTAQAEFADLTGQMQQGRIEFAVTVEEAVRDADISVDFVPDELESKLEIFCLVDRMAPPKTILCTPSHALSITDLASCTYRENRCFAVRGDLAQANALILLHPYYASGTSLEVVQSFFTKLAIDLATREDTSMPMLVKNVTLPLPRA